MAVTTKKLFPATTNATTTVFSPVSIQLNNQDDLDVYVTLSGGTRVLQNRNTLTNETAQASHKQVNDTTGLYFPAVSVGTPLYNYQLSTDNNTITFNSALPQGAVVFCERRTRDADSSYTTFASGSTIRATDLNNSSTESNFTAQDARNKTLEIEGAIFNGDIISPTYITSENIVDGTIQTADIGANQITNALVADDQIDSRHYVAGSIDLEHMSANSVDSDQYVDGSIDHVHLANDVIDGDNIQSSVINSEHYVDGSIDREHLAADIVDGTKIADDAIGAEHIQANSVSDSEIVTGTLDNRYYRETELDGGQLNNLYYTQTQLNPSATNPGDNVLDARYYTETEAEDRFLRQDSSETIASGDTWSASDSKVATSAAIDLRVIELVDNVGGFVPIPNETSFPTSNPDINTNNADKGGTIVSVSAASTALAPQSGTTLTIANGRGTGNPVIITGVTTTIPSGFGFLVETTATDHTYAFHRLLPVATQVATVANNITNIVNAGANVADINNFADLYQISTSAPTTRADNSSLQNGDLWFDSSSNKVLMIYDGSSGDGFTAATPNASDLANIAIVAGQIVFTEDLGNITDALATATGNTTLNTVAGIATEATTVAGIASNVTAVANNATNINAVAGKVVQMGLLGTVDTVNDMDALGTSAVISDMDTLADISSNITTVAGVSSNVTTVAGISSNVTAVAGNATNINAVAADATDIGAVAGKATEIGRLGTADAVADLAILGTADAVADMNTLGTSSNVTNMNTLAGISGNVTTVAGISSNVTTVAGNNAAVSTVAGNDADISTVAGSIGNVNTTAGSISNVNTVAGSISNVNTAASNVTNINNFANRYRIASSAPSSNNDAGDLYFDTSSNELRVYNGSAWQGGVTATGNLAGTGANTFSGDQTVNANIVISGTVDGKDISALGITGTTLDNGVTATTQAQSDNSTKVSTTAYVRTAISDLVNSAPSTLDTLGEIATALNNDAALNTTLTNSIATKLPLAGGTLTGDVSFNDNKKTKFGASDDLVIYHNSSNNNSYIQESGSGNLVIGGDMVNLTNAATTESYIRCTGNAQVELYHNNGKRFETTAGGAIVTGTLDTTGTIASAGHIKLGTDTGKFFAGASNDLQVYHDGSDSRIRDQSGNLKITTNNLVALNFAETQYILRGLNGAQVELYHAGNKKIETTSSGATITGTCTATTFSGSGASLTSLNASNISSGTIAAARIPTLNQNTTGNAATATNADTVDNLHASSFVRSDADDTLSGTYIFSNSGEYPVVIGSESGMNSGRLLLRGATNPYIRFREGNSDKAFIQWNSAGYLQLYNQETSESIKIASGTSGLKFLEGSSEYSVWHSGNDGSGSGLDADTVDGIQGANFVRSDTDDTLYGNYTISSSGNQKLLLRGSSNPYIRWQEGTTNKAYIQWVTDGELIIVNEESGEQLRLGSGANGLRYKNGSSFYTVWHAGNDGSGSGLDADLLDGVQGSNYMGRASNGSHWNVNSWLECSNSHGLYYPNNYAYHVYLQNQYLHLRNNSTSNGLYMTTNGGTLRGYVYVNSGNNVGFLNNVGSWIVQCDSSGNATFTGNVTAYSDARLKTNVNTIDNALDIVDQLRGVSFDWIESGKHSIGVIAQEIEEVLPEVVLTKKVFDEANPEEREIKSVDYGKIVGVLINAIKELRAEVAELKGGK